MDYTFVSSFKYTGSQGKTRKASQGNSAVKFGNEPNGSTIVIQAKVTIVNRAEFSIDQITFTIEYGQIKRYGKLINVARSIATVQGCILSSDSWHVC